MTPGEPAVSDEAAAQAVVEAMRQPAAPSLAGLEGKIQGTWWYASWFGAEGGASADAALTALHALEPAQPCGRYERRD
jgi:hypothetical protein